MKTKKRGLTGAWNAILLMAAVLGLAIVFGYYAQRIVTGLSDLTAVFTTILSSGSLLIALGLGGVSVFMLAMYVRKTGRIDEEAFKMIALASIALIFLWKGWTFVVINIAGRQITIPDQIFGFVVGIAASVFALIAFRAVKKGKLF